MDGWDVLVSTGMRQDNVRSLSFYVPGGLPSARDLQGLLLILESSLVWAVVARTEKAKNDAWVRVTQTSGEEEEECRREWRELKARSQAFKKSFSDFLVRKYRPLLFDAHSWVGSPPPPDLHSLMDVLRRRAGSTEESSWLEEEISNALRDLREMCSPESRSRRITRSRELDGSDFHIADFNEWIAAEFGRELLPTQKIRPGKSVEFIFDMVAITSMVVLQDHDVAKEIIVYTMAVLRAWMGKRPKVGPSSQTIKVPRLTGPLLQLMGRYDEVELEVKEDRLRLVLKRTRGGSSTSSPT